jgi:competence protein ComEC
MAVREYIPAALTDQYIITGLAHLLSMSGSHVAIFTAGIFLLFCFLPGRLRAVPVIVLLPLLIPLSGFTVTVVRAVIFAVAAMTAWLLDLRILSLRFLAVVAAGILLVSPYSLFSISFLLSFCAVFGIVALFKGRYRPVVMIVVVGLASTVFTLPLQLYFFGTSNVFSILTTVLLTPVVWLQMVLSVLSFVFPVVTVAPLSLVERFAAWLMEHAYSLSWHFFYVAKPPALFLGISFLAAFALSFTRFRPLSLIMLVLPLLPLYPSDTLVFPALPPSQKGYIMTSSGGSEIFFQGMRTTFTRVMVPEAGRLGIKTFDYGRIRIFDGKNLYLKIKNPEKFTGLVCINEDGCPFVYYTRSGSLKQPLSPNTLFYIIYKNKQVDPRIILQADSGRTVFSLK